VGLSDHSESVCIPAVAVALGARIIEKHFTLDRELPGPDHKASLEPDALRRMVEDIRTAEAALGSAEKRCTDSETNNRQIVRRSLVAARAIAKGEPFGPDNVIAKRPGDGLSPMRYHELLGQKSDRPYAPDEQIVMP
jgi:sialic acid synthase SpsE